VLTGTQDNEEIIERVAALDIGKAELVCRVRAPGEDRPGKRVTRRPHCFAGCRVGLALAPRGVWADFGDCCCPAGDL
jgi:hypothetical protein